MYLRGVARASSICIVTESRVLGDALTYVFRLRAGLRRVVVFRGTADMERTADAMRPAVVLVDLQLGAIEEALGYIARKWVATPILFFGCQHMREHALPPHRSGDRYLPRDATCEELLDALGAALRPHGLRAGVVARQRDHAATALESDEELSPREREIVALLEQGMSNRDIAVRLGLSVATVKNHVHHVLTKLHAHSRGQALARLRNHLGGES